MRLGSGGDGRRTRTGALFVRAQIAGSTVFLAVALLFVRSFLKAGAMDIGFQADGLVIAQLEPALYGLDGARAAAFAGDLATRVATLPGTTIAVADRVPYAVGYPKAEVISTGTVDCGAAPCKPVVFYAVGMRHFEALGLPLRVGPRVQHGGTGDGQCHCHQRNTRGALVARTAGARARRDGRS